MTPASKVLPLSRWDRIRGSLLGLVVGDALGVPVEFQPRERLDKNPVKDMRAYGTHNQPRGTWSDDSSMTFCTMEAFLETHSHLRAFGKSAENFVRWKEDGYWTPHGTVFDIGGTTSIAISSIKSLGGSCANVPAGEDTNGNGSLMRMLPVALWSLGLPAEQAFAFGESMSCITHPHIRSRICCGLFNLLVKHLVRGSSPFEALTMATAESSRRVPDSEYPSVRRLWSASSDILFCDRSKIKSTGYVVHTLEAALWCLGRHDTFEDTVLAAVNLGDDTDTTGAVAGSLAGAHYGASNIPLDWIDVLARKDDVLALVDRFTEEVCERVPSQNCLGGPDH